jgi:hypothetical protein
MLTLRSSCLNLPRAGINRCEPPHPAFIPSLNLNIYTWLVVPVLDIIVRVQKYKVGNGEKWRLKINNKVIRGWLSPNTTE